MPFEMSKEAIMEEQLLESICFFKNFVSDMEKVIAYLNENMTLDHQNDLIRSEALKHLISALTAHNMRDYEDANKHVNAALQKTHAQEVVDLSDDRPRTEALIKLSVYIQKALANEKALKKMVSSIKGNDKCNQNSNI